MILETMRVHNPSGIGSMLVNVKDYDPKIHKVFVEEVPSEEIVAEAEIENIDATDLPIAEKKPRKAWGRPKKKQ